MGHYRQQCVAASVTDVVFGNYTVKKASESHVVTYLSIQNEFLDYKNNNELMKKYRLSRDADLRCMAIISKQNY